MRQILTGKEGMGKERQENKRGGQTKGEDEEGDA